MAKGNQPNSDARAVTAKEEMLLLLFRDLAAHQQREVILELQAMFDANQVARKQLRGKPLRATSNEAVRAAYKDVPHPAQKRAAKKAKKNPGRPPGAPLDDYPDE